MTRNIQQPATNSSSTQIVEVPTSTGFNAGDLVYFKGSTNNYVSPTVTPSAFANPTGTLSFDLSASQPYNYSPVGFPVSPVLSGSNASGYGYLGGTSGQSAAILSNGNIVTIWHQAQYASITNPGRIYFQITTPAGVQVVAPTVVSTTIYNSSYSQATVVALTGGGFAILFINNNGGTTNLPCYAIYTNTGAVTLALVNDTTYTFTTSSANVSCNLLALPNGGLVMVVPSTTANTLYFKIITATGTVTKAWTTVGFNCNNTGASVGLAARSTNEFLVTAWNNVSTATVSYAIFNASGTAVVAATTFTPSVVTRGNGNAIDASTLSDGTTFIIAMSGNNSVNSAPGTNGWCKIPTGNTVSATTAAIPAANLSTSGSNHPYFVSVLGVAGGGFVIAYCDNTAGIQYAFYNSSGTAISGTNANGALGLFIPGAVIANQTYVRVTLFENTTTGNVSFYWSPHSISTNANIFTVNVSNSTYAFTYSNNETVVYASTSSTNASTISVANSTPTSAVYTLASTLTGSVTGTLPTTIASTNTIATASSDMMTCTVSNGNILICYIQTASPYTVYVNVYTSTGTLLQTINAGNSTSSQISARGSLQIIPLSGGGFVVGYLSSGSSVYKLTSYNASYAQLATTTLSVTTVDANAPAALAALTNNNFVVVVARNASVDQVGATVYAGTTMAIQQAEVTIAVTAGSGCLVAVAGNNYGGFAVAYSDGLNLAIKSFYQLNATTWNVISTWNAITTTGRIPTTRGMVYNGAGWYVIPQSNTTSTTQMVIAMYGDWSASGLLYTGNYALDSYLNFTYATAMTGFGQLAFIRKDSGSAGVLIVTNGSPTLSNASSTNPTLPATPTSLPTMPSAATWYSASMTQAGGYRMLVAWVTGSTGTISFQIINFYPFTIAYTVPTTQVSTNALVSINPSNTSTSTTIPNTVLAGVAATTAAAGTAGQLIINGPAQLSSSYNSSATGAFDTTGLAVQGVKGVYNGRNVIMQGNS